MVLWLTNAVLLRCNQSRVGCRPVVLEVIQSAQGAGLSNAPPVRPDRALGFLDHLEYGRKSIAHIRPELRDLHLDAPRGVEELLRCLAQRLELALLLDEIRPAGKYQVSFDGSRLPSGLYVCRMEAAGKALFVMGTAFDAVSVVDVATVLGCSEESVRTHLRRARSRLATSLGESEDDE